MAIQRGDVVSSTKGGLFLVTSTTNFAAIGRLRHFAATILPIDNFSKREIATGTGYLDLSLNALETRYFVVADYKTVDDLSLRISELTANWLAVADLLEG